MQNTEKEALTEIVLVGGGHSHVEVIRRFGLVPLTGGRLTVICTDAQTPYSGMLPGYVAGHYEAEDIHITSSAQILPTHSARVRERFLRELAARGVLLHVGAEIGRVSGGHIETCNGVSVDADEIVWVTHAGGARWLRDTGLALDSDGFVQVDDSLCTVSDERIFAAGDVASLVSGPLAKAGVFAVRQGPILAENLRRAALGRPLLRYRPQRRWLALITTGDRYAVASWGPIGVAGRWVWRWKDAIDRRFMARYRDLPAR